MPAPRKREPYPGFDWSWVPTPETPALLFDIETDGLLDETSTIHCICAKDFLTGESFSFGPGGIEDGLRLLSAAPLLVAHNGLCFDIPAIQKLHPNLLLPRLFDTLTASRLIWTNLKDLDFTQLRKKSCRFPPKLAGSHSLDAWGQRLGVMKGDYGKTTENAWNQWSEDMQRYCEQDVEVLEALYRHILDQRYSPEALALEHEFQAVIFHQERTGVWFDERAAQSLYAELAAKRNDAVTTLQEVFPPKRIEEIFIPKANNRTRGYVKGVPFTKVRYEPFNPASRQQIADRLIEKHGWKPSSSRTRGSPRLTKMCSASLPFPECKPLVDYLELLKIIGMLAEGKNGWLKLVGPDGRIHGRVITNGAVTGRCTHNSQPRADPGTGPVRETCRALFAAPPRSCRWGPTPAGLNCGCWPTTCGLRRRGLRQGAARRRHPHRQPARRAGNRDNEDVHLRLPLRSRRRKLSAPSWPPSPLPPSRPNGDGRSRPVLPVTASHKRLIDDVQGVLTGPGKRPTSSASTGGTCISAPRTRP
ncbi:MAG: ribonuclease H-like domain-containing protein [Bilophila wadsworthia]